ncbi:DUF6000 family protein [Flavobacterium reichenbachii]|uniref:Uncharacterized protein n=1 Tax=Flavobacterium reichenbachii TaxID=362418 RepID=A0A085ZKC0_9FLAO|nr:DUF6000 family protein [Flavobacterium reichenbachii]KFF04884.1 hypothetical protein IW19_04780 [Flavobacterium reichenbachii]OXB12130.1 hypothetical protein B0A68_19400 [Flavobacterium reichenbachii]
MDTEFLSTNYVNPVYGHLMTHTDIFKKPDQEQNDFKQKFTEIAADASDDIIKKLLWNDNWRFSMVGSWLIFAKNKTEFITEIGTLLLSGKAGTIGYCYTLAKFATPKCSEYLAGYLEKELRFEKIPTEKFQDTAIYALVYIDKKNKTNFSKPFLEPSGLWTKFIEFEFRGKLKDSSKWGDFEANYKNFVSMFEFMNSLTNED